MSIDDLDISLTETLRNSDLTPLTVDIGEIGLDELLASDAAKDIPVIGSLVKLVNVGTSVRNFLFTKNLLRFLKSLPDVPPDQRRKQIDKLAEDEGSRKRVGENLMLLLDRVNNVQKPEMMGKAFGAYLQGNIGRSQLNRLYQAIDLIDVTCIADLKKVYESEYGHAELPNVFLATAEHSHLAICGLLSIEFGGIIGHGENRPKKMNPDGRSWSEEVATIRQAGYRQNEVGRLFIKYVTA